MGLSGSLFAGVVGSFFAAFPRFPRRAPRGGGDAPDSSSRAEDGSGSHEGVVGLSGSLFAGVVVSFFAAFPRFPRRAPRGGGDAPAGSSRAEDGSGSQEGVRGSLFAGVVDSFFAGVVDSFFAGVVIFAGGAEGIFSPSSSFERCSARVVASSRFARPATPAESSAESGRCCFFAAFPRLPRRAPRGGGGPSCRGLHFSGGPC